MAADIYLADFTGAKAINVTPIATSTADPINSPRAIRLAKACPAMRTACAKLDQAAKAIRAAIA
jgi:hypothetical protein